MKHSFAFDPTYGYTLDDLLQLEPPEEPGDFSVFWQRRFKHALSILPQPILSPSAFICEGFRVYDLSYTSTDQIQIGGWLLEPEQVTARCGLMLGHGYGGLEQPSFDLPCHNAVYLIPCFRGISRSRCATIPQTPQQHVVHGIESRDSYVIGGCVDDCWTGISALLSLHPELENNIGYMGISFGGGIGALALPWDNRITLAHLNVPAFGHQPLRLKLPTTGSALGLQNYVNSLRHIPATLSYYDSAVAAKYIHQKMHIAAALFDPVVAPPGQFAIYNALKCPKKLKILTAGHFEFAGLQQEEICLIQQLGEFFNCNEPGIA